MGVNSIIDLISRPMIAMTGQPGDVSGGSFIAQFGVFIPILLLMYLLMIRPQQKKQKAHKKMLEELKKGDRIVTSGGLFGNIFAFNDQRASVILKVGGEVKLEVLKSSISGKVQD